MLVVKVRFERQKGYYLWNVILPFFLIVTMAWSAFSIPVESHEARIGVVLSCLIATIAYKFVVASSLPRLSYMTILDIFTLIGVAFLGTIILLLCISAAYLNKIEEEKSKAFEFQSFKASLAAHILFNAFFVVYVARLSLQNAKATRAWNSCDATAYEIESDEIKTTPGTWEKSNVVLQREFAEPDMKRLYAALKEK